MGPWEYLGIFTYPDNEAAFKVLGKIAKLEVFAEEIANRNKLADRYDALLGCEDCVVCELWSVDDDCAYAEPNTPITAAAVILTAT